MAHFLLSMHFPMKKLPQTSAGVRFLQHIFGLQGVLTCLDGLQNKMGVGAGYAFNALDLTVYGFQLIGRGTGDVQEEVKVAGEVIAVGNIGVVDDGFAEAVIELGMLQADFHEGGHVEAQLLAVDLYFVALDDAAVFHLADTIHNGRNRQVHFLADIGSGFSGVVLENVQNGIIDLIHKKPPIFCFIKIMHTL